MYLLSGTLNPYPKSGIWRFMCVASVYPISGICLWLCMCLYHILSDVYIGTMEYHALYSLMRYNLCKHTHTHTHTQYLLHDPESDMAKCFRSLLIYFHEPEVNEIKA